MPEYTVELLSDQEAESPAEAVRGVLRAAPGLTFKVTDEDGKVSWVDLAGNADE